MHRARRVRTPTHWPLPCAFHSRMFESAAPDRPARRLFPFFTSSGGTMTSSLSRAAISLCAIIGVATGCGSGNSSAETKPRPMVTAEDIDQNGQSIEAVLQAMAPGALVSRTSDGGISIQIRGPASFSGSSEPLYVIDDVALQPGPYGGLVGVNPHDIQSIDILMRPEDTAIYGLRGANGVIVIHTKKPGKPRS
jgi:TonB-dependent SusC/RagA subfamily outer membrane receptor